MARVQNTPNANRKTKPLPDSHPYQDVRKVGDAYGEKEFASQHRSGLSKKRRRVVVLLVMLCSAAIIGWSIAGWLSQVSQNAATVSTVAAYELDVGEFENWLGAELAAGGYEGDPPSLSQTTVASGVSDLYRQILEYVLIEDAPEPSWDVGPLLPPRLRDSGETVIEPRFEEGQLPLGGSVETVVNAAPIAAAVAAVALIAVFIATKPGGGKAFGWAMRKLGLRVIITEALIGGYLLWQASKFAESVSPLDSEGLMANLLATVLVYDLSPFIYAVTAAVVAFAAGLAFSGRKGARLSN